jgi:PPM family protein phosphatase
VIGGDILNKFNLNLKEDKETSPLIVQNLTDMGMIRKNNEDFCGHLIPNDKIVRDRFGSLFVISDGVGGSSAGEVASAEAVNVLIQEYYFGNYSERIPQRLKNAFQYTAMHIFEISSGPNLALKNMKCTLSCLLTIGDKFYITHIGDSKIFLLRSNRLIQLTKDHSLVGKLLRMGFISPEEARVHPNRHILLKSLGDQPILPPDFYSGKIMAGDVFCLITDGILEHGTSEELKEFLKKDISLDGLKEIVKEMNSRGGYDNMTIMTVKVKDIR